MNHIIFNKQGMPNLTAPLKELLHDQSNFYNQFKNAAI